LLIQFAEEIGLSAS